MSAVATADAGSVQPRRRDHHLRLSVAQFVLAGLTAGAFLLRTIDLTRVPPGFFADEASYGYNAHLILTTGRDEYGEWVPLFFRAFGDYKLPLFVYLDVPFVAVFGLGELAVRLCSAVLGALTVTAVYVLAKQIFGHELPALAAAALLAVLPWHLMLTRTGFGEVAVLPLPLTLALAAFIRAARTGASFVPAAVLFGLSCYSYRSAWVLLPVLVPILVVLYRRAVLAQGRRALLAGGVLAAMILPILWHLVGGSGDRSSDVSIFDARHEHGVLRTFADQYVSYFELGFLFGDGPDDFVLRHYLPGHGVLYLFMGPLIVAGLAGLLLERRRAGAVLLALVVIHPLPGALSSSSPITTRAIFGTVVWCLLAGAGVGYVADWFGRLPRPAARRWVATAAALAAILGAGWNVGRFAVRYFREYPELSAGYYGWQAGAEELLDFLAARQDGYDDLYLDGEFNAPWVFIPFYLGDSCPKCKIGDLTGYDPTRRQLFALRVHNPRLPDYDIAVVGELDDPGGEPAFIVFEVVRSRRSPA